MNIIHILQITQMVSAILMIVLILLQQRGGGLSGAIGGGEAVSYSSRRGVEKYIFRSTIVLAVIFLGSAILQLIM